MPTEEHINTREKTFGIVVTARSRHADLWEAAQKLGSASALARRVGQSVNDIVAWINLKRCPGKKHPRRQELERSLFEVTGKTWDDLWPDELREAVGSGELGRQMAVRREVGFCQLAALANNRLTLPSPEEELLREEKRGLIIEAVNSLSPRLRDIIKIRHRLIDDPNDNRTLEGIGKATGVSKERVRQLIIKAERKLREKLVEMGVV